MYTSIDYTVISLGRRIPCPTDKEVSYINLVFGRDVTIKIDYCYYHQAELIYCCLCDLLMAISLIDLLSRTSFTMQNSQMVRARLQHTGIFN